MECKKVANLESCTCSASCGKKGVCCDCLAYHLANRELPGCCFPAEAERSWDRSFSNFAKAWKL